MDRPKYPRVKCENSLKQKICLDKRKLIRDLYLKGYTRKWIQNKLLLDYNIKLSRSQTRMLTLDPKTLTKEQNSHNKYQRDHYYIDPEYVKKITERVNINLKRRYKTDPIFRKFTLDVRKTYRHG